MFCGSPGRMLASMSEIDPRADTPLMDWSELDVSSTGTVTLLLADVEGSTRLWESQPKEMTAGLARLHQTVSEIIATHDSFVAAFARASDAVAAALEMQRAPLAPIRLRIGLHTGEIQLRDEGNYAGPTINRTARLRDLGPALARLLAEFAAVEAVVDHPPRRESIARDMERDLWFAAAFLDTVGLQIVDGHDMDFTGPDPAGPPSVARTGTADLRAVDGIDDHAERGHASMNSSITACHCMARISSPAARAWLR
jgi:class 3 adenylate cyclase